MLPSPPSDLNTVFTAQALYKYRTRLVSRMACNNPNDATRTSCFENSAKPCHFPYTMIPFAKSARKDKYCGNISVALKVLVQGFVHNLNCKGCPGTFIATKTLPQYLSFFFLEDFANGSVQNSQKLRQDQCTNYCPLDNSSTSLDTEF